MIWVLFYGGLERHYRSHSICFFVVIVLADVQNPPIIEEYRVEKVFFLRVFLINKFIDNNIFLTNEFTHEYKITDEKFIVEHFRL